jgi:hypothetical protein
MPDADASDYAESGTPKQSWLGTHRSAIITGLIFPLVVALSVWGAKLAWDYYHPPVAFPHVVNWWPTNQTASQPATANVRVHNDGKGSTDGCKIHWMAQDPSSHKSYELAVSAEFGFGPGDYFPDAHSVAVLSGPNPVQPPAQPGTVGAMIDPTAPLVEQLDTWVYVQCPDHRSPDSSRQSVSMTP